MSSIGLHYLDYFFNRCTELFGDLAEFLKNGLISCKSHIAYNNSQTLQQLNFLHYNTSRNLI